MEYETEFIEKVIENGELKILCPKCGTKMNECLQENMTEGQEADYIAGFNHPYECPACGHYGLY